MNAFRFLVALNEADDDYIWQAGHAGNTGRAVHARKNPRLLCRALLAALIVIALAATVYGVGEIIGIWNDRWLQTPDPDPVQVVREAITRQIEKDYTVSVTVEEILIDKTETQKIYAWVPDSMLAMLNGYGAKPEALEGKQPEDVRAVYARYTVIYDHTKTYYRDGTLYQYFYLVRDTDGNWEIIESSYAQEVKPIADPNSGMPVEKENQAVPDR